MSVPYSGHWLSIWPDCRQWKQDFCACRTGISCALNWCLGTPCFINLNFSVRNRDASSLSTLNPSNFSTFEYESRLLWPSKEASASGSPSCVLAFSGLSFIRDRDGVASSGSFWLDDLELRLLANLAFVTDAWTTTVVDDLNFKLTRECRILGHNHDAPTIEKT